MDYVCSLSSAIWLRAYTMILSEQELCEIILQYLDLAMIIKICGLYDFAMCHICVII
jgi:hypothetical protein